MRAQSLIFFAAALAIVSALPSPSTLQPGKRDWTNDQAGNINLTFSDQTVKLGDLPIDTIMSNLTSLCSDSGLCETDSLVLTGYKFFIGGYGDSGKDEIVTIQASGSYPTMLHDNLLEALGAAVNAVANCSVVNGIYPCYGSATAYCPELKYSVNECTVPKYWGINYQPPDLGDAAPPFIGNSLDVAYPSDGFCSTFATIGGAVAGAINGIAGGVFSLIGLVCVDT